MNKITYFTKGVKRKGTSCFVFVSTVLLFGNIFGISVGGNDITSHVIDEITIQETLDSPSVIAIDTRQLRGNPVMEGKIRIPVLESGFTDNVKCTEIFYIDRIPAEFFYTLFYISKYIMVALNEVN